jgi:Mrp family chromosome partitioning ATPase
VAGTLAVTQVAGPAIRAAHAKATRTTKSEVEKPAVSTIERPSTAELFESPGLGAMLKKKSVVRAETLQESRTIAAKLMTATPPLAQDEETVQSPAAEMPIADATHFDNHRSPTDTGLPSEASGSDESSLATTIAESVLPKWHPMLQVDRIVWPSACSRLQGMAAEALDQMVDGLRKVQTAGRKVIGMASCGDGEGVSTLLLAAARRMSSQGLSVAIIDANLASPTLAAAIGLLPQLGWENALAGDAPLEDVVIDSEADHVAILPTIHAPAEISAAAVESHLATLALYFDSVLVDLGSLFAADGEWNEAASEIGARTGGMILVQNVRKTTPNRLADAQSYLEQSGVALVGTIQNFVVA